jgi:CubicO group peptidase (beta-lactamase class C family)
MLGWICEAASGATMPTLMSHLLWGKIGAESDAVIAIDQYGTGMFDGGINATLRDMARFGSLFLNDGLSVGGNRVLSANWIEQTLAGGPDSREAFANSPGDNRMPGGMYRNQMWFPYEGNDVLLCLGIHGQMVYINRPAQVVGVKLSSWPLPQDASKLFPTLRAFDAIAAELGSQPPAPPQEILPLFNRPERARPHPAAGTAKS